MKFDGEHGIFTKLLIQTSLPSWGLMPFPLVKSSTWEEKRPKTIFVAEIVIWTKKILIYL